jgi:hypothetical protein
MSTAQDKLEKRFNAYWTARGWRISEQYKDIDINVMRDIVRWVWMEHAKEQG